MLYSTSQIALNTIAVGVLYCAHERGTKQRSKKTSESLVKGKKDSRSHPPEHPDKACVEMSWSNARACDMMHTSRSSGETLDKQYGGPLVDLRSGLPTEGEDSK